MIRKYLFFCLLLLLMVSCHKKNPKVVINQNNVIQVLTEYGKENPENEVTIETSLGNIRLKLYDDTPLHRANFIKLVKEDHFREGEFYRVINGFMIQGGDLQHQLEYTIPAEFSSKYFHKKGALAMARTDDNNPGMESSSSEFYIMHGSPYDELQIDEDAINLNLTLTPEQRETYLNIGGDMSLDQKYTVFGEVTDGLDVVDKIANTRVYGEKPVKKIVFKISLKEKPRG
jgi:peptidyl-prolyl cis-trans isomerase B (cyclophilin B)